MLYVVPGTVPATVVGMFHRRSGGRADWTGVGLLVVLFGVVVVLGRW